MKFKAMGRLCVQEYCCVLCDQVAEDGSIQQWISNECCMWPIRGLPYLTIENVIILLGLKEKEQEMIRFDHAELMQGEFLDADANEVRVLPMSMQVKLMGESFILVNDEQAVFALPVKCFSPMDKLKDPQIWQRGDCFVVKNGLMLEGAVWPDREAAKEIAKRFRRLAPLEWYGAEAESEGADE